MSDKTIPITGGCLCGAVRYESTESPPNVGYCHCRMCQRSAGGLHIVWVFFPWSSFRFTQGEPTYYRSSDAAERGFCASCGSPLIMRDQTDELCVHVGTLDHPEDWPPNYAHGGMESKVPWEVITDELPRYTTDEDPAVQETLAAAKKASEQT